MTLPNWARRGRVGWHNTGAARPDFAREPGPGQESVWDYPRPPRLETDERRVEVRLGEFVIADTTRALRLLETASPPTFYLPVEDVVEARLEPCGHGSRCEWKGRAVYYDVCAGERRVPRAGWSYPEAFADYEALAGRIAFYPHELSCFVDGERVRAQAGGFYGGWITDEIVGPFKGEAGTSGW